MRILKNTLLAGLMLLFSCMKGEAQSGAKNTFLSFLNTYGYCYYSTLVFISVY